MADCIVVTPTCPVEASTYGYAPNLAVSVFFVCVFGACALAQLLLGIRFRTYTWCAGILLGVALECVGYAGRIMTHYNVWNGNAFDLQLITLIIAPSLMLAGIDLILKHLVSTFGPEHSYIKPPLITWTFISLDILSLVLQAIGGILASIASNQVSALSLLQTGNDLLVAGIALQVAQLVAFGLFSVSWLIRLHRAHRETGYEKLPQRAKFMLQRRSFQLFALSTVISYLTILTRCIYR